MNLPEALGQPPTDQEGVADDDDGERKQAKKQIKSDFLDKIPLTPYILTFPYSPVCVAP